MKEVHFYNFCILNKFIIINVESNFYKFININRVLMKVVKDWL